MTITATKTDERAYRALCEESERTGWPKRFTDDLHKYDRRALAVDDTSFGWCLREDGTHVVRPPVDVQVQREAGRATALTARACSEAFGADRCKWYFWDGTRLEPMRNALELDDRLWEAVSRHR